MTATQFVSLLFIATASAIPCNGELLISDDLPLELPLPGAHQLRMLAPTLLELNLVTAGSSSSAGASDWGFADSDGSLRLPAPGEFLVIAGGKANAVTAVGFKRRVLYAPLKHRDLRVENSIYLELDKPIAEGKAITVLNPDHRLWAAGSHYAVRADPLRWTPVVHVNQVGYLPGGAKQAMAGYYLGSLGELNWDAAFARAKTPGSSTNPPAPAAMVFEIIEASSGRPVFQGTLKPRPDRGFPYPCYQQVLEADFSQFRRPGEYRLAIQGLGASFPFQIGDGVAGVFARAYALGLYHQRCGTSNALPFTRFTHAACHLAPAAVPTAPDTATFVNEVLADEAANGSNPRQTAPIMTNVAACLYPFVNPGPVDVQGGHHDAGDYSKYTANSAAFIHILVFAADNFPGVRQVDNLGIPESGDGKSDVLQEAKWEADFLARMQDADGGFYFMVYPRNRRYEDDVTPDHGDAQVVYPKNTSVTARATAALAQCASSPEFKREFPEAAARYLKQAVRGWQFLQRAIARFGKDGAYQRITPYSDEFMHDDDLAWAACELFLATGDPAYEDKLMAWLNPSDPGTRRWGWWRLFESYGNAIRSYAFAARSGRVSRSQLMPLYLEECEAEIAAAGEDEFQRASASAYGTSFPLETKRTGTAGWYFSGDAAFNLAVACQLDYPVLDDPRPKYMAALLSNLNYEAGCNPVNVAYLTGVGSRRQREIVDQFAQNDRRVLPPSGIPLGNIQGGFGWLDFYGKELNALSYPADSDPAAPYPMYDRWGDSFNLCQEFVILNQARALAYSCWLMAQTPLRSQPWRAGVARIEGVPREPRVGQHSSIRLSAPGFDLSGATTVWEASRREPAFGGTFEFAPAAAGLQWIEAEAQLQDGRRLFAVTNFTAR